ncbi:ATP-binding protein [Cyclonatronum proteinivorum]|uniref:ATP-binding protein n=1 Tax=Cyclonatronum proteinivorum TaxID=1457365 RepID=UPI001F0B9779|nr:ATP-binding protein [Cyclonatronum proteinivorum]
MALTGPRQSGKTTLARHLFADKPYSTLEDPETFQFATEDPRGFLASFPDGAVLDEIQRVPALFSYLQRILDESRAKGLFILTGSNNFLLQQNISQTLAGRVAYLNLLPFSLHELSQANASETDPKPEISFKPDSLMLNGFYPPVHDQQIPGPQWLPQYIRTYVERDVRQIRNITDLMAFDRFVKLVAGRNGQELNVTALALEAGIDQKTAQAWLSILVSSFVIFLLKPYHRNFNKTITKRPKLYFWDTGLVCALLGIRTTADLAQHPARGSLFESLIVSEVGKHFMHQGLEPRMYYWRDKSGRELDLILESGSTPIPIEIKAGMTVQPAFFRNIRYWQKLTDTPQAYIIYGGTQRQQRSDGARVIPWDQLTEILQAQLS